MSTKQRNPSRWLSLALVGLLLSTVPQRMAYGSPFTWVGACGTTNPYDQCSVGSGTSILYRTNWSSVPVPVAQLPTANDDLTIAGFDVSLPTGNLSFNSLNHSGGTLSVYGLGTPGSPGSLATLSGTTRISSAYGGGLLNYGTLVPGAIGMGSSLDVFSPAYIRNFGLTDIDGSAGLPHSMTLVDSTFQNLSSGTLRLDSGSINSISFVHPLTPCGWVENQGLFEIENTLSNSYINTAFSNSGLVHVKQYRASFYTPSGCVAPSVHTGTMLVDQGAEALFGGRSSFTNAQFLGAGWIHLGLGSITSIFNSTFTNMVLSDGEILLTGSATCTHSCDLRSATIRGTGVNSFNVAAGAHLLVGNYLGGSVRVEDLTINNGGTITFSGALVSPLGVNNLLVNNGTIEFTGFPAGIAAGQSGVRSMLLINNGVIQNSTTGSIQHAQFDVVANEASGSINLTSGDLEIKRYLDHHGSITVGANATLQISNPITIPSSLALGGTLATSRVNLVGGEIRAQSSTASIEGTLVNSNGRVSLQNNGTPQRLSVSSYRQEEGGSLDLTIGSATQFSQLRSQGEVRLAGALDVSLLAGFTPTANLTIPLIQAGSIRGRFTSVHLPVQPGATLLPVIVYTTSGVLLTYVATTGITVSGPSRDLVVGYPTRFWVMAARAGTFPIEAGSTVQWTSQDPQILTVESTGLALPHGPGTTTITAVFGSFVASKSVTVRAAPSIQRVVRGSVATPENEVIGDSLMPALSATGQYLVFQSDSKSLVDNDGNYSYDIFIRDLVHKTTRLVSAGPNGEPTDGDSFLPSVSADGRYIAYASAATNIVAGDNNEADDVFLADALSGTTIKVSSSTTQGKHSGRPSISPDGRFVLFFSQGALLPADTNGKTDVYLYDQFSHTTTLVGVGNDGSIGNNDAGELAAMSDDARYIVFASLASNLVAGDTNQKWDVFLRDRVAGTTIRINLSPLGQQTSGDFYSRFVAISGDGTKVAFDSESTGILKNDGNAAVDVFLYDRASRVTTLVSLSNSGSQLNGSSKAPSLNANGTILTYYTYATNVASEEPQDVPQAIVRNLATNEQYFASSDIFDAPSNGSSVAFRAPAMDSSGCHIAYESLANNIVPLDRNSERDVFIYDNCAFRTAVPTPTPTPTQRPVPLPARLKQIKSRVRISLPAVSGATYRVTITLQKPKMPRAKRAPSPRTITRVVTQPTVFLKVPQVGTKILVQYSYIAGTGGATASAQSLATAFTVRKHK